MRTNVAETKREKAWQDLPLAQDVENPQGFALMRALMSSAHLLEVVADHSLQAKGLSLPRMRLLLRLFAEEQHGSKEGVSPSALSQHQHISKNTVSSLLGSLEEQGLIERALCNEDKRSFKIRLTRTGRELIRAALPAHNTLIAETFAALSAEDQKILFKVLSKLRESLMRQIEKIDLSSYKTSAE